ncbi:DNA-3-methyladenine glycosylase 2 family protein [Hydrogenophaga pseudoflava]|uniref:DNA-3-methyladenine glycosylase 2 family protein n=1 Tax=Hydrogenophaga pseudoflava TaxID=47421 RepID=UPI0027E44D64|nr:AlkA N-terminal domain-containing protein [Hydrogenophaga pseudoflava]MDQ7745475.1 AlkA N-terminal domain-containing protein [Hydrogenophaga pseudoflava]
MDHSTLPDADALYRALSARDARFDGRFFTGVTSTGIYCRPVCRVRTPKRDNCQFFEHAAQAERAGFRPCLRCRPELAPRDRHWSTEDAGDILIRQATALLDTPETWAGGEDAPPALEQLAARLGVSARHIRRLFEQRLGVSPLQYLQTRRLLAAKQMLADTGLPVAQVALAAGFASLRRFNDAFVGRYGLNPTQLRRSRPTPGSDRSHAPAEVRLSWRPPYRAQEVLRFFADRALPGLETVDPAQQILRRTLRIAVRGTPASGWLQIRFLPDENRIGMRVSEGLLPALPGVIDRVRAALDLDADPLAIDAVLHADFPDSDGMRVPGAFDGFELAVRAVLGQQVTVAAARTLCGRLLERLGEPLADGPPGLQRLFPPPEVLADLDGQVLGEIGIVRQRQQAIRALARAVAEGRLVLDGRADPASTLSSLEALPGIGPWTAQYIAMRALRWPDAWPSGDVVLLHALGVRNLPAPAARREAERIARRWRPWRSYAVIRAWTTPPNFEASEEMSHDRS